MNALNIARINERVPYEVWQTMKIKKNRHCLGGADFFCTFAPKLEQHEDIRYWHELCRT